MFGQDLCFTEAGCTGVSFSSSSARECCVSTEDGQSFQMNGVCVVTQCIGEDHSLMHAPSITNYI